MTIELTVATTRDAVAKKDLHMPFNDVTLKKVRGVIMQLRDEQSAAATATTNHMCRNNGLVTRCEVGVGVAPAAGESMTIDIQKNGTSILVGGPLSIDQAHATPKGCFDVTGNLVAGTQFAVSDVLTVVRTYTAGGGPAMTATCVWVDAGG
jgi:hypothetical protein